MTEKKPEAGEWWQVDGDRVFIAGKTRNGIPIAEYKNGCLYEIESAEKCEHLPDCDSFDWQPETFPQFYRGDKWPETDAYVRFDAKDKPGVVFTTDGKQVTVSEFKFYDIAECLREHHWVKLTQAEAEARIRKPEPELKPEMSSRELEFLEIVAKQRDTIDKLAKRLEKLERAAITYETICGSFR